MTHRTPHRALVDAPHTKTAAADGATREGAHGSRTAATSAAVPSLTPSDTASQPDRARCGARSTILAPSPKVEPGPATQADGPPIAVCVANFDGHTRLWASEIARGE